MNRSQKTFENKPLLAHLALIAVTIFYSGNYIIAQDVMQGDFLPPMALVFFRVFGACLLFWIFQRYFVNEKLDRKDIPYFLLCSLVGIVIAQNVFMMGLEKTPTINAALLISTTPIIVTFLSVVILKEKMTRNKSIGLLLATIGTAILLRGKGRFDLSTDYLWGNTLMIVNSISYGLYLVLIKPLLKKYHPLTVVKWVFTFAAPAILIIALPDLRAVNWESFTGYAWWGLIYVVVFATFFTYSLNAFAIKIVGPVIAGLYLFAQPFLTSLLSVYFGKDEITTFKIFAGILILGGLFFAAKKTFPQNK